LRGLTRRTGALARFAADLGRIAQIGEEQLGGKVVIALHAGALAGDHRDRARETRAAIGAGKTVRGHQHQTARAGGNPGARRVGDARHRARGLFHRQRILRHSFGGDFRVVIEIEIGKLAGQEILAGQRVERVLRRNPGHRHGAFGERIGIARHIGRHAGDLAADEDAQRKVVALGGIRAFHLAEAHGHAFRARAHHDGVGGIGAGALRGFDKRSGAVDQALGVILHVISEVRPVCRSAKSA
jgi:hypothetical protein